MTNNRILTATLFDTIRRFALLEHGHVFVACKQYAQLVKLYDEYERTHGSWFKWRGGPGPWPEEWCWFTDDSNKRGVFFTWDKKEFPSICPTLVLEVSFPLELEAA